MSALTDRLEAVRKWIRSHYPYEDGYKGELEIGNHLDTLKAKGQACLDTEHGLGVADVKLNLLCQIEALRRLDGLEFRKPVVIAATYGEERGLMGARRVISAWKGLKPALVVDGGHSAP